MSWLLALIALIILGALLSWTATRLDRMNHRVETAASALDAALARRCAAALELATSGELDPASSLLLADAAHRARSAEPDDAAVFSRVQTDLSKTLRAALEAAASPGSSTAELTSGPVPVELTGSDRPMGAIEQYPAGLNRETRADLRRACALVAMARRLHNDAVAQALSLRSIWVVRWFGLAGHSQPPQTLDFDDTVSFEELAS